MKRRAVIVHEAGHDHLGTTGAAADRVGGLEDGDVDPSAGEIGGGSEPIGPAADDGGSRHAAAIVIASLSRKRVVRS